MMFPVEFKDSTSIVTIFIYKDEGDKREVDVGHDRESEKIIDKLGVDGLVRNCESWLVDCNDVLEEV